MFCSTCGAAARADNRFCGVCGTLFPVGVAETLIDEAAEPRFCASCGLLTPADAAYCRSCGAPTPLAPTRSAPRLYDPAYDPLREDGLPPGFREFAPFWRRLIAHAVIDTVMFYFVFGMSFFGSIFVAVIAQNPAYLVLMAVGPFVYLWWGNATGRPPSKQAMGIRVVCADTGAPPGWRRGLIRTLGYGLSWGFLWIGCLWALVDERRRAWHDLMAGTVVVRDPARTAPPPSLWRDPPALQYVPDLRPAPATRTTDAPEPRTIQWQRYDATPSP